jgi:hypothetical protein
MSNRQLEIAKYQSAAENVRFAGLLQWQVFSTFLLVHTIFLGVLLSVLLLGSPNPNRFGVLAVCVVGILFVFLWAGSYCRHSSYYEFRMAQAKQCEPDEFHLFNYEGERFAEGDKVAISGKKHKIPPLGMTLRTRRGGIIMVISFYVFYILIIGFVFLQNRF